VSCSYSPTPLTPQSFPPFVQTNSPRSSGTTLPVILHQLVEYALRSAPMGRFWLLLQRLNEFRSNPGAPETYEMESSGRPAQRSCTGVLLQRYHPWTFGVQSSRSICCAGAPLNEGCQPVCRPSSSLYNESRWFPMH